MGHHAAQAFLVAAGTAVDFSGVSGKNFVRPVRVGGQLTAHGSAVNAPGGKLLLNKMGVGQTTHSTDGQRSQVSDFIAEFEEASLLTEFGVLFRRDGIGKLTVIGQRHMETGDAGLFQQRNEHR